MPITLETIVKSGTITGAQGAQGAAGTPITANNQELLFNNAGSAAGAANLLWVAANSELLITGNVISNTSGTIKTTASISSGTLTIDTRLATVFEINLNADITTITINNVYPAPRTSSVIFVFIGDGTVRSITWPASFKFELGSAPDINAGNGRRTIITAFTYDGGTYWHAVRSANALE